MSDKSLIIKPVAAAVGVAFLTSLAVSSTAVADDNPFSAADLDNGLLLAGDDGDKEGKCGEGKCGEGKCGDDKGDDDSGEEGSCGEDSGEEGSCGGDQG